MSPRGARAGALVLLQLLLLVALCRQRAQACRAKPGSKSGHSTAWRRRGCGKGAGGGGGLRDDVERMLCELGWGVGSRAAMRGFPRARARPAPCWDGDRSRPEDWGLEGLDVRPGFPCPLLSRRGRWQVVCGQRQLAHPTQHCGSSIAKCIALAPCNCTQSEQHPWRSAASRVWTGRAVVARS